MTTTLEKPPGTLPETLPDQLALDMPLTEKETRDLVRCEDVIAENLRAFQKTGNALLQIRDGRLYRATHANFDRYLQERWEMSASQAYRLMGAVDVIGNLSPIGDGNEVLPLNESQARPLSLLPAEQQPSAWRRAVEIAGGAQPTAAQVQQAVDEVRPRAARADAPPDPPTLFPDASTFEASGYKAPDPAPLTPGGDGQIHREVSLAEGVSAGPVLTVEMSAGGTALVDEDWEEGYGNQAGMDAGEESPDAEAPVRAADGSQEEQAIPAATGSGDGADAGADHPRQPDEPQALSDGDADVVDAPDAPGGVGTPAAQSHAGVHPPAKPPVHTPKVAPSAPKPPVTAAPSLPDGYTTAIVKKDDLNAAMALGLWPPGAAMRTLAEAREAAAQTAASAAPEIAAPSPAMALAAVSAARLAETNATSGTVLFQAETQLLDELFPMREATLAEHIVAVLVTSRLRQILSVYADAAPADANQASEQASEQDSEQGDTE